MGFTIIDCVIGLVALVILVTILQRGDQENDQKRQYRSCRGDRLELWKELEDGDTEEKSKQLLLSHLQKKENHDVHVCNTPELFQKIPGQESNYIIF